MLVWRWVSLDDTKCAGSCSLMMLSAISNNSFLLSAVSERAVVMISLCVALGLLLEFVVFLMVSISSLLIGLLCCCGSRSMMWLVLMWCGKCVGS